jgi:hypothetical protein
MSTLNEFKGEVTWAYLLTKFYIKKGARNTYCNCFPGLLLFQAIAGHWGQIQARIVEFAIVCTTKIQAKLSDAKPLVKY